MSLLLPLIYGVLNKFHKVIYRAMEKARRQIAAHTAESFGCQTLGSYISDYTSIIGRALFYTFLYK
jgi:hypothetical protein